ncbi:hypothetical protein D1007_26364 [Hordeum vulgare]|nr:hypothetical protein D1007_26364 [Hordeum vulgare]
MHLLLRGPGDAMAMPPSTPATRNHPQPDPACSRVPQACQSMRIHSTTWFVYFMGFVLLQGGITSKMTISLDTSTIIDVLVVSYLSLCLAAHHVLMTASQHCHEKPLTHPHPNKPLFGYVTICSAFLYRC